MEKILKYTYYICLGLFCVFVFYMTSVMFLSPRQDALKRGFIPCTEALVNNLTYCQKGKIFCPLQYLGKDLVCNTKVVWNGLILWGKGVQKTPWNNYLYTPVIVAPTDDELEYTGNPASDMAAIERQHNFIEQKHRELEDAKMRALQLEEKRLINDPEAVLPTAYFSNKTKETEGKSEDIQDESLIEKLDIPLSAEVKGKQQKNTNGNILHKINKITEEKLQNGELKDE